MDPEPLRLKTHIVFPSHHASVYKRVSNIFVFLPTLTHLHSDTIGLRSWGSPCIGAFRVVPRSHQFSPENVFEKSTFRNVLRKTSAEFPTRGSKRVSQKSFQNLFSKVRLRWNEFTKFFLFKAPYAHRRQATSGIENECIAITLRPLDRRFVVLFACKGSSLR